MNVLQEVNAAATAAVKTALERAGMPAKMLAKEVYEEIPRPSAKIIFGDTTVAWGGVGTLERKCELIAVWNAPDTDCYKLDCLAAQQVIEEYLMVYGLELESGAVIYVEEIQSTVADAAVLMRFAVTMHTTITPGGEEGAGDSGELMEILQLNVNTEE